MRLDLAAASVAICALVATSDAGADQAETPSTAAQFFRAGLAAYERHEYRAAALAFEEAFRRAPRGPAMYNAGRGWEAAGESARAADDFDAALSAGDLDAHDAGVARERLAALAPGFATIDVDAPATASVSIDDVDRGSIPRGHHVGPGTHHVHVSRSDGSAVDRDFTLAAGESQSMTVEEAPQPAPVAQPAPAPAPVVIVAAQPAPSAGRTWAWITLGATGVLGAAGAVTYLLFANDRSSFDAQGDHDGALHDRASAERTATYVLWAAAGACAVTSTVLFVASRARSRPTVGIRIGPASASVEGSF